MMMIVPVIGILDRQMLEQNIEMEMATKISASGEKEYVYNVHVVYYITFISDFDIRH